MYMYNMKSESDARKTLRRLSMTYTKHRRARAHTQNSNFISMVGLAINVAANFA